MLEKLALCEKRYLETEQALSDPAIMADMEAYKKYMKEYKSLTPIIEKYREHKAALEDIMENYDKLNLNISLLHLYFNDINKSCISLFKLNSF